VIELGTCPPRKKERDERICITSDVVKVRGEDPATQGCLRENRMGR